jgi:hypothetical protein
VTEAEWLTCDAVPPLLEYLIGRASDRKFRLFACAFCRRTWDALADERCRGAVCLAERYADGEASEAEMEDARQAMAVACQDLALRPGSSASQSWAWGAARAALFDTAFWKPNAASQGAVGVARLADEAAWRARGEPGPGVETTAQLALLRDVFENPYRPGWVDPAWLAWREGTIPCLAEAIYAERAFDRLPILGDVLEEAGCRDADLLTHCHQPGEHFRGCWAVDLLLGKE